jgi:twitching motility protein PilT
MINQREVHVDIDSFAGALRSALREDPDVILVGEMRDFETISAAITAAETGHLVLSTLHTTGAAETLDRIIDVYPPHSQGQCRSQLANNLVAVVSQTLVPTADGRGRVAALEVMSCNDAISAMIRENKIFQIPSAITTGKATGMFSLDQDLARLTRQGYISEEVGKSRSQDPAEYKRFLGMAM